MTNHAIQSYQTKIGFLRVLHNISFEGGELVPLPEYNDHAANVDAWTHQDGFVYPPESQQYRSERYDLILGQPLPEGLEPIPNTRKPASIYQLPASHQLNLTHTLHPDNPRFGDAGFILHAIGFAYGVRPQFSDWYFDSRVPIKAGNEDSITINAASDFITLAYRKWRKFSPAGRNLSLNLLWMATRLKSYHTYWEKFLFSYMVIDGCYKLAVKECGMPKISSHRKRISALCAHFEISNDKQHQDVIDRIVDLRNSLFHESLWSDQLMGSPGNRSDLDHVKFLKNLYRRTLAAIFDFKGTYTSSPWKTIDKYWFSQ